MSDLKRNHVNTHGRPRCRFDMMIRWPPFAGRRINPLTVRGDRFGDTDPDKMFRMLLRYFIKEHERWLFAQLHDNTHEFQTDEHVILKWSSGVVVVNRLNKYTAMIKDLRLPDELK